MLTLVINAEFAVAPKKSLAEVALKLLVEPFEKVTVIVPGIMLNEESVTKIFAPSPVTPGLKVSVSGVGLLVLNVILPPAAPQNKPPVADAVHVGEPAPKFPLNPL